MATGEWFVQVHPITGPAHEPIYFDDFATTLSFVKMFKTFGPGNIQRVHTPSSATREEQNELSENGCVPV